MRAAVIYVPRGTVDGVPLTAGSIRSCHASKIAIFLRDSASRAAEARARRWQRTATGTRSTHAGGAKACTADSASTNVPKTWSIALARIRKSPTQRAADALAQSTCLLMTETRSRGGTVVGGDKSGAHYT